MAVPRAARLRTLAVAAFALVAAPVAAGQTPAQAGDGTAAERDAREHRWREERAAERRERAAERAAERRRRQREAAERERRAEAYRERKRKLESLFEEDESGPAR